jgi:hypothetical protein
MTKTKPRVTKPRIINLPLVTKRVEHTWKDAWLCIVWTIIAVACAAATILFDLITRGG